MLRECRTSATRRPGRSLAHHPGSTSSATARSTDRPACLGGWLRGAGACGASGPELCLCDGRALQDCLLDRELGRVGSPLGRRRSDRGDPRRGGLTALCPARLLAGSVPRNRRGGRRGRPARRAPRDAPPPRREAHGEGATDQARCDGPWPATGAPACGSWSQRTVHGRWRRDDSARYSDAPVSRLALARCARGPRWSKRRLPLAEAPG
jgi:hypothetical protein